ncbi:MAG: cation diffusion facilitator family transporter [Bacilli bacterium]
MTDLLLKIFVKDYKNTKNETVRKNYGLLGSFFGLFTNLFLFLSKIIIGIILGMFSIIADSVNNLSDFGNNTISLFGFKLAGKKPDREHPFGHQRIEDIAALIISCVIIGLGFVMGYQGILDLVAFIQSVSSSGHPVIDSSFLTAEGNKDYTKLIVTIVILAMAVGIKLLQSLLYHSLGKRIDSLQLLALSKDSRNDVISTILVIVGVVITWFTGFSVDCFFTIAVAILVITSGIGILRESIDILIGQKPDKDVIDGIVSIVKKYKLVLGMHDLFIHTYGKISYAVIHIEVDSKLPLVEAHEVSDAIEKEVNEELAICLTVHLDPVSYDDPDTEKYKSMIQEGLKEMPGEFSFHEFRLVKDSCCDRLIFDLVVPDEKNNEAGKSEISSVLNSKTNMKLGKPTRLIINYDDYLQDFLAGTDAENIVK